MLRLFSGLIAIALASLGAQAQATPRIEVGSSALPENPPNENTPGRTAIFVLPDAAARIRQVGESNFMAIYLNTLGNFPGLRLKIIPFGSENVRFVLEGFAGISATYAGVSVAFGGGIRLDINAVQDAAGQNAFFVSPGVDVYVVPAEPLNRAWLDFSPFEDVVLVATNVDIAWVHEFDPHFAFELGLRGGVVFGVLGRDAGNQDAVGGWSPEINLYSGVRF